jgi:hypothetical protein
MKTRFELVDGTVHVLYERSTGNRGRRMPVLCFVQVLVFEQQVSGLLCFQCHLDSWKSAMVKKYCERMDWVRRKRDPNPPLATHEGSVPEPTWILRRENNARDGEMSSSFETNTIFHVFPQICSSQNLFVCAGPSFLTLLRTLC